MKKKLTLFVLLTLSLSLFSCSTNEQNSGTNNDNNNNNQIVDDNENEDNNQGESNDQEEADEIMRINLEINGEIFEADIENSPTGKTFLDLLPMELEMNELNGNEKYFYLDESLPVNPYSPNTIEKGDIMLFGSSCLVIFYENFNTPYSYTRIGKINNANNLDLVLGSGDVTVTFSK